MADDADTYYLLLDEPVKSCLVALRDLILSMDKDLSAVWRYGMPFFYYRKKMFCYLWVHKKYQQPYLGMVEGKSLDHPKLISENRSRMKIMLFDPLKDLPVRTIRKIVKDSIEFYKKQKTASRI